MTTTTDLKTCLNCASPLNEGDHYCAQCSQSAHIHRFSIPHIGHELFHALTHADKGALHLLKELSIRPGVVAREYVLEGKRKKYFNPFTFLVLVLGLSVVVYSYFKPYETNRSANTSPSVQVSPPMSANPTDQGRMQRRQEVLSFMNKRANLVAFAALPIFAFVFWLFFIRMGINYAEHLVANVFFASYFQLFAALLGTVLGLLHQPFTFFNNLQLGFQLLYLPIAYYQFLSYKQPMKFFLTLLAVLLAIGTWALISWQIIRFYIVQGT